jgi:membrane protein YdbS with pleckstrin-like domain
MTRILFATAFLLGAAAVGWIALDFAGSHALAFIITAVIGGVYLIGIIELVQFRRATGTLEDALGAIPPLAENPAQGLEQ